MKTIDMKSAIALVMEGTKLSHEERLAKQKERLKELVAYAREHSPYFKELYKNLPEDFSLENLPPTNKGDLLANYDSYVTDPELSLEKIRAYLARDPEDASLLLGKYTALQTSGSTGNPFPMARDEYHNTIHGVLVATRLMGCAPKGLLDLTRHKMAFILHLSPSASSYGGYLRTKRAHPNEQDNLIAYSVLESEESLVEKLNAFQPEVIGGYPPSLVLLAEAKAAGKLDVPVKLFSSSAELLTDENYHRIHDVFGCPILNNYCSTEGGEVAMTHLGPELYINEDFVIVEPVDKDHKVIRNGEEFSSGILITDLTNYVQPIIRYYMNDSVRILKSPRADFDFPVLEIDGRVWDDFSIGGKHFTTKSLEVKAKFVPGILQFQFLQTSDNALEVRGVCVADADPSEILEKVAANVRKYLEEAGCAGVTVTPSLAPLYHNENGGKIPMFKKL